LNLISKIKLSTIFDQILYFLNIAIFNACRSTENIQIFLMTMPSSAVLGYLFVRHPSLITHLREYPYILNIPSFTQQCSVYAPVHVATTVIEIVLNISAKKHHLLQFVGLMLASQNIKNYVFFCPLPVFLKKIFLMSQSALIKVIFASIIYRYLCLEREPLWYIWVASSLFQNKPFWRWWSDCFWW